MRSGRPSINGYLRFDSDQGDPLFSFRYMHPAMGWIDRYISVSDAPPRPLDKETRGLSTTDQRASDEMIELIPCSNYIASYGRQQHQQIAQTSSAGNDIRHGFRYHDLYRSLSAHLSNGE